MRQDVCSMLLNEELGQVGFEPTCPKTVDFKSTAYAVSPLPHLLAV